MTEGLLLLEDKVPFDVLEVHLILASLGLQCPSSFRLVYSHQLPLAASLALSWLFFFFQQCDNKQLPQFNTLCAGATMYQTESAVVPGASAR